MVMAETVTLHFRYSEEEYAAAVRAYMLHTPEVLARLCVFAGLLAGGAFLMSLLADLDLLFSLLLAAAVCAGIAGGTLYRFPRLRFRREPKFRDEYHLEFSEEGIHLVTDNVDSRLSWGLYTKASEHDKFYLLIYGSNYAMTVVPKRAFTSARQEASFRELLRRKLAPQLKERDVAGQLEDSYVPPPEPPDWR